MRNLNPHQLPALLRAAQEGALSDAAKERLQWIAHFIGNQGSMQGTCQHFGISRSTLHRWLERFDPADLSTLEEGTHAPHNVRQPSVPAHVVALIRAYRERWPLIGKEKVSRLILQEHGVTISPSSVGRVIDRECFYFANTPLHWRKRLEGKNSSGTMSVHVGDNDKVEAGAGAGSSKFWLRAAVMLGMMMQGLAASLAIAVLWQLNEKPKTTAASVPAVEILESVLPSVSTDE